MIYELPELYDAQYAHYRDDLAFYQKLAEDYGGPVLELGSGTGRVTAALAQAGHQVVGVELSAAMLERARERSSQQVTLLQGDMRKLDLPETLPQRFPLVIAPFNTLMHAYTLAEQDATFASVRRHLAAGGLFALDLYNPDFGALGVLRREAEWQQVGGAQAELFLVQHHDPDAQLVESRYYLDEVAPDGQLRRQRAVLKQRYYTRFELERALRQAGFSQLRFFGGFERQRYSHKAPLLIALARA